MAQVIINTTAVRNNGDVALIVALATAFERRGHSVLFATAHPDVMTELHGRRNVCGEVLGYDYPRFRRRYFEDLAALICLLFSSAYRRADAIIGAPGGYINSYYGFNWRRAIYRWAHRLGKKTAIYAQSVGPLDEADRRGLASFSRDVDVLVTRDDHSRETAIAAEFAPDRLMSSVDAIFLNPPATSAYSALSNIVAISVREWRHDRRDIASYSEMVHSLAQRLLRRGFTIEFISTCQGIRDYVDDSALASEIAARLRRNLGQDIPVSVNAGALGIDALTKRMPIYRLVLGTRLHMCLLALLAGVPAFNISYESKGTECYRYLGFEEYTVDYNADVGLAVQKLDHFLDDEASIRRLMPAILAEQHRRATSDFDLFLARLGLGSANGHERHVFARAQRRDGR